MDPYIAQHDPWIAQIHRLRPTYTAECVKDYTPLHVYLGCVWVVIHVKYITYEGLLHNTLALDVDTVQEAVCRAYTANSCLMHEKALSLCEWFRNLVKRNVVRATPAVVELNSDWLNRFTRTRGSVLPEPGHQDWVIAKHSKQRQHVARTRGRVTETGNGVGRIKWRR